MLEEEEGGDGVVVIPGEPRGTAGVPSIMGCGSVMPIVGGGSGVGWTLKVGMVV